MYWLFTAITGKHCDNVDNSNDVSITYYPEKMHFIVIRCPRMAMSRVGEDHIINGGSYFGTSAMYQLKTCFSEAEKSPAYTQIFTSNQW